MAIKLNMIGRFGNQLFQWAHARARAELAGASLDCPPWVGEKVFESVSYVQPGGQTETVVGYCQNQQSIIYSRKQVLNWLKIKPEIKAKLDAIIPDGEIVAHLRRGDFGGYGYVVVSKESYIKAAIMHGYDPKEIVWVSDEHPGRHPDFTGDLEFLPDFYRMMKARVLFRANSSFSWWAATLGHARVFSPVIDGIAGGIEEKDCSFVEGNYPKLANLDGITDLHLFNERDRYDYPLTADSLVIDCGGYDGDFALAINLAFLCNIIVFEPEPNKARSLRSQFEGNPKIKVIGCAVGSHERTETMRVHGSMTGAFADGESFKAAVLDIAIFANRPVDLLKLNIEGMEYEVLERLIECDLVKNIANIQVQFHGCAPDSVKRYGKIRDALCKTHRTTFDELWTWTNFERI